jgi:hypothetical protein
LIKRGVLYFVIITVILFVLRSVHYKGLLRTQGYYSKYREAFLESKYAEVLFLGSSRVEMHYDTRAFDSVTGLSSFNLGLPGATVHEAFAAYRGYLACHQPPEYLIYEIDYHAMMERSSGIMEFSNFFPFLSNKTLRRELNKIDERINWFYYVPYYSWPYTGLKNISTSLHGWLNIPGKTDHLYHKGFYREISRDQLVYRPTLRKNVYMNVSERSYLDSLIILCEKNKTTLTFITSPYFACAGLDVANRARITRQVKDIAISHALNYYDLSCLPFCNRRDFFVDHYHMNYRGTKAFTPWLCWVFNNKIRHCALK